jgi:hypothetical protein
MLLVYENNEKTCGIVCVFSVNKAMLRTIHANSARIRVGYANAFPLGVSRSLQARPTVMQSMESRLVTGIKNEAKRNSLQTSWL